MPRQLSVALLLTAATPLAFAAADNPAWLHIGNPQPVESAKTAYYELATQRLGEGMDPTYILKFGDSPRRFSESTGPFAGEWTFFARQGEMLPRSAQRIRVSDNPPYRVDIDLYCEGSDCSKISEELRGMRAPRPDWNAHSMEAWRKIVAGEPCDRLAPAFRPPVGYPREELRRGIEGTVQLSVFHNRCGDVRDAEIFRSSGNRSLDRTALVHSLKWRVKPAALNTAGWKREELQFRLDDPANPPPPNPIDVQDVGSFTIRPSR